MNDPATSKDRWEARYRNASAPLFGSEPSEFLRQVVARSDFDPESVLLLADGDGRNSRWLATRGCNAMAVDLSKAATDRARRRDADAGVFINRIVADLGTWQGVEERFGAVFLIALHSEPQIRRRAIEIGMRHLEPGGWLVLEGFASSQTRRGTMGPTDPEKLYDLAETVAWIEPTCRVFEALEGMVLLAEGDGHDGPADMVRILARRRKN